MLYTQQQQLIDIQMVMLSNQDQETADFLDWVHNKQNVFLSDLSSDEFAALQDKYERETYEDGAG